MSRPVHYRGRITAGPDGTGTAHLEPEPVELAAVEDTASRLARRLDEQGLMLADLRRDVSGERMPPRLSMEVVQAITRARINLRTAVAHCERAAVALRDSTIPNTGDDDYGE